MADPKSDGRMIRKDVSDSHKIAALSAPAAVLFFMLIPHYNSHGKMNGGPGYIKDEVVPFIDYLTYDNLAVYLQEISDKTNVKWFKADGRSWLHSLKFLTDHQKLDKSKLGTDSLPSYSGVSPELVESKSGLTPELVHDKEEVEVEVKEEENLKPDACGKVDKPAEIEDETLLAAQQRLVDKRDKLKNGCPEEGNDAREPERRGEDDKPQGAEVILLKPGMPINAGVG